MTLQYGEVDAYSWNTAQCTVVTVALSFAFYNLKKKAFVLVCFLIFFFYFFFLNSSVLSFEYVFNLCILQKIFAWTLEFLPEMCQAPESDTNTPEGLSAETPPWCGISFLSGRCHLRMSSYLRSLRGPLASPNSKKGRKAVTTGRSERRQVREQLKLFLECLERGCWTPSASLK